MYHLLKATQNRLVQTALLVAVLAVLGGQVLEVQHNHAGAEIGSECLFCQSTADTAAVTTTEHFSTPLTRTPFPHHSRGYTLAQIRLLPPTRAPPHTS